MKPAQSGCQAQVNSSVSGVTQDRSDLSGSHLHPTDLWVLVQHWLLACFPASVAPLSSLPWRIVGSRQGRLPTRVAV